MEGPKALRPMQIYTYGEVSVPVGTAHSVIKRCTNAQGFGAAVLHAGTGPILTVYWNTERACLFFFDDAEDGLGATANAPFDLEDPITNTFLLENGQMDDYPSQITCPLPVAIQAIEEFLAHPQRPSTVCWFEN